ncbi:MAG: phytoene/squalene synthase family protein [Bryobacterales bacterium]|nr:phytoene/squalene synthase family protein [Bryobacterales bacterium]
MRSLEECYSHCRRIAKARARNFFLSLAALPRPKSDAMCAVYAFMRQADDLVDEPGIPANARQAGILEWRNRLRAHLAGAKDDPVLTALANTAERYEIPHAYFFALLDGMESDLEGHAFDTFEDLYRYCYRAASVVGLTTIHVLGFEDDSALALAERCGIAFQLTNILRDISVDAAMGRVYLPADELRAFDLDRRELLDGALSADDTRFQRLMEFQADRAEGYYRESAPLVGLVGRPCRPALWAMIATYWRLLAQIRKRRFDVFGTRIQVPALSRLAIAVRTTWLRTIGGTPSLPA